MTKRIRVDTAPISLVPLPGPECVVMVGERLIDAEPAAIYTLDGKHWIAAAIPRGVGFMGRFGNGEALAVVFTGDRFVSYWENDIDSSQQVIASPTGATWIRQPDPGGFFQTDAFVYAMAASGRGLVVVVGDYFRDPDFSDSHLGLVVSQDYGETFGVPGEVATAAPTPVTLSVVPDNFADALTVSGASWAIRCLMDTTTGEPGEPNQAGYGVHTIWLRWVSPSAPGAFTLDTLGSTDENGDPGWDTVLAVYTGSTLGDLVNVTYDDDSGGNGLSSLNFVYEANTTYYIQASAYYDVIPDGRIIQVNMGPASSQVLGGFIYGVAVSDNNVFVFGSDLHYDGAVSHDAGLTWEAVNTDGITYGPDSVVAISGDWLYSGESASHVFWRWRVGHEHDPPAPIPSPWSRDYAPGVAVHSIGFAVGPFSMFKGGSDGNAILGFGRGPWTHAPMIASRDGGRTWVEIGHTADQTYLNAGFDILPVLPDEWDNLALNGAAWGFGYWWVSNYNAGRFPGATAPYILRGSEDFTQWVGIFPPGLHDTRPGPMIGNSL